MKRANRIISTGIAVSCVASILLACGGGDGAADTPVTITVVGPNAVSQWNEIATTTINVPASVTGTAEEQRPNSAVDLATVHVAIYDAVMAIVGTHRPYAVTPMTAAAGASQVAAVASAAGATGNVILQLTVLRCVPTNEPPVA